jgi:hypothetical protein
MLFIKFAHPIRLIDQMFGPKIALNTFLDLCSGDEYDL